MSSRGSVSGIAPSRIAVARKLAHANSSSRIRERAAWRACSSRSEVLGLDSRPCSATSTRLRSTSCSERSKQLGQHGLDRAHGIPLVRDDRDEPAAEVLDRLVHDLVQAVLLGLEVVIQGGRADADVGRDVGPLGVLVPVPAEAIRRRGEDLVALAAPATTLAALPELNSSW